MPRSVVGSMSRPCTPPMTAPRTRGMNAQRDDERRWNVCFEPNSLPSSQTEADRKNVTPKIAADEVLAILGSIVAPL